MTIAEKRRSIVFTLDRSIDRFTFEPRAEVGDDNVQKTEFRQTAIPIDDDLKRRKSSIRRKVDRLHFRSER